MQRIKRFLAIFFVCAIPVAPLVGCNFDEWWNAKPDGLRADVENANASLQFAQKSLADATAMLEAAETRAAELEAQYAALKEQATTDAERAILAEFEAATKLARSTAEALKAQSLDMSTTVNKAQATAQEAEDKVAEADTNGEVVMIAASIAASLAGFPVIGSLFDSFRTRKSRAKIVENIGLATMKKEKTPEGKTILTVDGSELKKLNTTAGVESLISKLRLAS